MFNFSNPTNTASTTSQNNTSLTPVTGALVPAGQVAPSGGLFGAGTSNSGGLFGQSGATTFGQPTSTTNTFGQQPTTNTFRQQSTAFTGATNMPTFSFGGGSTQQSSTTPAATSTGLFGTSGGFGSSGTGVFGQQSTSTGTGLFGQQPTNTTSGLFGQSSTPSTTTNPFGQVQSISTPFGQPQTVAPSSPFGQATSTFGSSNSFGSTNTFGSNTSGTNVFGSNTSSTNPFGSSTSNVFGQTATSSPFGQPASSTPFGSSTVTTSSPFGGSVFGQQPSTNPFGTTTTTGSIFGAPSSSTTSSTSTFTSLSTGTGTPPFSATVDSADSTLGSGGNTLLQSITAMPAYKSKSFEELRLEDYLKGRKGQAFGPASQAGLFGQVQQGQIGQQQSQINQTSMGLFGQQSATSSTPFGQQSSVFGQQPSSTPFGQPASTSTFGQPASTSTFGQPASTSTFGQPAATSTFGQSAATSTSHFEQPLASAFGQPSSTPFGQQQQSTGLFGQPSSTTTRTGLFGQPSSSTNTIGLFGQPQSSTGLFGQHAATPAAPSNTTSSFTFGTPAPAADTSFFGSTPSATTGLSAPNTFSTPAPSVGFTAPSTGFPASSGGLFGAPSTTTSGTGGFQFAPTSTATSTAVKPFTFTSNNLFGAPAPVITTTPAANPFSSTSSNPFSFSASTTAPTISATPLQFSFDKGPTSFTPSGPNASNAPLTPFTQPFSVSQSMNTLPSITTFSQGQGQQNYLTSSLISETPFGKHPWLDSNISGGLATQASNQSHVDLRSSIAFKPTLTALKSSQSANTLATIKEVPQGVTTKHQQQPIRRHMNFAPKFTLSPLGHTPTSSSGFQVKKDLKRLVIVPTVASKMTFHEPVTQSNESENIKNHNSNTPNFGTTYSSLKETDWEPIGNGYSISPSLTSLLTSTGTLPILTNLRVKRSGFGEIKFLSQIDMKPFLEASAYQKDLLVELLVGSERGLIRIEDKSVSLYPASEDDSASSEEAEKEPYEDTIQQRPPIGSGFNVPAIISLSNCFPLTDHLSTSAANQEDLKTINAVVIDKFIQKLKAVPETSFIDYDPQRGQWTFRVEHF